MSYYTQLLLQIIFGSLIIGTVAALVFALVCELFGWYNARGRYNGPFSKERRK